MDERTESQMDAELQHSNLIYSTLKQSYMKISAQYVKACWKKCGKLHISCILSSKRSITHSNIKRDFY